MPRTLAGKDKAAARARWVGLHTPDVDNVHAFEPDEESLPREELRHPPDF